MGCRKMNVLGRLPANLPTEVVLISYHLPYQCTYINITYLSHVTVPLDKDSCPSVHVKIT